MSAERPLRILYLANANSIHTQRWVGWFARRHEVRLVSVPSVAARDWKHPQIPLISGAPAYRVPWLSALHIAAFVRREIARFRPDIVHAHFLVPNAWIAVLTGFSPVVTTAWGGDLFRQPPNVMRAHRLALPRAALNTGDSQEAVDRLRELVGDESAVELVQFGVDTDTFAPAAPSGELRRAWGIPEGARIVVSPRILQPLYNGKTIAKAFIELCARARTDGQSSHEDLYLVFLAYHADVAYQAEVRALLNDAGLLDRVRFVPSVAHADMPELYREAAAIVSVPSSDTTPVSVLEAMACGAPVIASSLPSLREWITEGVTGFMAPPEDAGALTAKLQQALALTRSEHERITAAAREMVLARASQDAEMTRMEQLYRRLLARS